MRAESSVLLGLAAGMLTLGDVADQVVVDGDQRAVQEIFDQRSGAMSDR